MSLRIPGTAGVGLLKHVAVLEAFMELSQTDPLPTTPGQKSHNQDATLGLLSCVDCGWHCLSARFCPRSLRMIDGLSSRSHGAQQLWSREAAAPGAKLVLDSQLLKATRQWWEGSEPGMNPPTSLRVTADQKQHRGPNDTPTFTFVNKELRGLLSEPSESFDCFFLKLQQ